MTSEIEKLLLKKSPYTEKLNSINRYLFASIKNLISSSFYFKRQDTNQLVVSCELPKQEPLEVKRYPITTIGYWEVSKKNSFTIDEEKLLDKIAQHLQTLYYEEWTYSYSFCQNKGCCYFPCHKTDYPNSFSCLFCYCPLYTLKDCGGNFKILNNGLKDCTNCLLPHKESNYKYIMKRLGEAQS